MGNATDAEIGLTLSCVEDLDARCSLVTGRRAIAEAVVRRWTTPRGRLGYDPDYGFDVRQYLNDDVDARTLALIRSGMVAEAKKDERVLDVDVTITPPADGSGIGAYKFECFIYDADGPFEFTFAATEASVRLLNASSGGTSLPIPVPPAPTIISLSPSAADIAGGETIIVTGTNLLGATIRIDGVSVVVTQIDYDHVSFVSPAHADGSVLVILTTPNGVAGIALEYEAFVDAPVLTSLDYDLADKAGGDTVTITGTDLDSATDVTVGGTSASITANTSTSLSFTMPAKTSGTYDVEVTTAGGTSNALSIEAWSPVDLTLQGYWRASYGGSPWAGVASAGGSSGRDLTEATTPPAVGSAVNGRTPANFEDADLLGGAALTTYFTVSSWSMWVLLYVDAVDSGGNGEGEVFSDSLGTWGMNTRNNSGDKIGIENYDGGWKRVEVALTTGAWTLVQAKYDGVDLFIRTGNNSWTTLACGNNASMAGTIRVGVSRAAFARFFDGKMLEIALASSSGALSDASLTKVRKYLECRYDFAPGSLA